MSIIGYLRVSTSRQSLEHQKYEIMSFAKSNNLTVNVWVEETVSSRLPLNERKLGEMLNTVTKGDLIITCEISRLGRSLFEIMEILRLCINKGCSLRTIKENYTIANDVQSKVLAFAFGLAAEIERQLISQRTKASLDSLRASGKVLGRPLGAESKSLKISGCKDKIMNMLEQGYSKSEIARSLGVQRSTLNRFLKRLEQSNN